MGENKTNEQIKAEVLELLNKIVLLTKDAKEHLDTPIISQVSTKSSAVPFYYEPKPSRWDAYESTIAEERIDLPVLKTYQGLMDSLINAEIEKVMFRTGMIKVDYPSKLVANSDISLSGVSVYDKLSTMNGNMKVYNPYTGQMEDYHGGYPEEDLGCKHSWKSYMGFSEKYDYCDKPECKERREYSGKE